MRPDSYRYGGGAGTSTLTPVALVGFVLAVICILGLPRKYTALPIIWMTLLIPGDQQIYIAGVHLFLLRLVVGFGLLRAWTYGRIRGSSWYGGHNKVDRAFTVCILAQAVAPMILFRDPQAVTYELGYVWDWLGGYFLSRWMLQDKDDVYRTLRYLAILMIPVAVCMMFEQLKQVNVFNYVGGVPLAPSIREGKVRAQGAFQHSLTAGFFAAVIAPLFVVLWKSRRGTLMAVAGSLAAAVVAWASNSSTTYLAYGSALLGIAAWSQRNRMKLIRRAIAGGLLALHMVMKAPVWFLLARIDITGGSSGYHRALLVDACIRHFTDWCLIGTDSNGAWGLDMFDIQNQYVNVAQVGGLVALVAFVLIIVESFRLLGLAVRRAGPDRRTAWCLWAFGCSLFANVIGFFGVNYFDQSRVAWFLLIAMVVALTKVRSHAESGDPGNEVVLSTPITASSWFGGTDPVTHAGLRS